MPLLLLASAADVGLCLGALERGARPPFKDVLTTHLLARTIRDAVERYRPASPGGTHLSDPLTGLANRDGLLAQAAHLWRSPTRLRKGATLLYLRWTAWRTSTPRRGRPPATAPWRRRPRRCARPSAAPTCVPAWRPTSSSWPSRPPEATASILTERLEDTLQAYNARDSARARWC